MEKVTVAYIGRFQPFCGHHRQIVQFIDSQDDVGDIVIVKGGSQWNDGNHDPHSSASRNPFTAQECCRMINLSLAGQISKPYRIVKVADTQTRMTDPLWKEWVANIILAIGNNNFVVYVNEPHTVLAFGAAGIACRPFMIEGLGPRATVIREKIAFVPEEEWSKYVDPYIDPEVADYIKKINGPARIRLLLAVQ